MRIATLAAAVGLVLSAPATAATLEDTARSALAACATQSGNEAAGVIIATADGEYRFTVPAAGNRDSFRLSFTLKHGEHLAALFHTHPGRDSGAEYFSDNDIQVARQLGVPSFILVTDSGTVREFIPGVTSVTHGARMRDGQISAGLVLR